MYVIGYVNGSAVDKKGLVLLLKGEVTMRTRGLVPC